MRLIERLRLWLAFALIGRLPVLANVKIERLEASTIDGGACSYRGVTIGKITEPTGVVAIGHGALADHIGTVKTLGVPLSDLIRDSRGGLPSASHVRALPWLFGH